MKRLIAVAVAAMLVLALGLFVVGCEGKPDAVTAPDAELAAAQQQAMVLSKADPRVRAVMAVQDRHTSRLLAEDGIVGTATGVSESGDVVIKIYLAREGVRNIPTQLDGVTVEAEVTGEFRAMKGRPGGGGGGGGVSHKATQTPPIQLGTSGGWGYDLANGYCCGGTLGSLISTGGTQYVLSNYHVFESDIVSGGNNRVAQTGDPIIQPGLIDVSCNFNNAQTVATLVKSSSLPGSNVDASIAAVVPGMVSSDGAILEIGTLSSQTVAASIGQKVKKSGRTTGLSRSSIDGLNATVSVTYENECAGGTAFTKTYTGQIIIKNRGSKFLAGGDSGSLMVEDVNNNPRAVGLLYAGSSTLAVANPIDEVLNFFGASMVGN